MQCVCCTSSAGSGKFRWSTAPCTSCRQGRTFATGRVLPSSCSAPGWSEHPRLVGADRGDEESGGLPCGGTRNERRDAASTNADGMIAVATTGAGMAPPGGSNTAAATSKTDAPERRGGAGVETGTGTSVGAADSRVAESTAAANAVGRAAIEVEPSRSIVSGTAGRDAPASRSHSDSAIAALSQGTAEVLTPPVGALGHQLEEWIDWISLPSKWADLDELPEACHAYRLGQESALSNTIRNIAKFVASAACSGAPPFVVPLERQSEDLPGHANPIVIGSLVDWVRRRYPQATDMGYLQCHVRPTSSFGRGWSPPSICCAP